MSTSREAAAVVTRLNPDSAAEVANALRLVATPSGDPAEVRAFLDRFGVWVCEKVDRLIVDWQA